MIAVVGEAVTVMYRSLVFWERPRLRATSDGRHVLGAKLVRLLEYASNNALSVFSTSHLLRLFRNAKTNLTILAAIYYDLGLR